MAEKTDWSKKVDVAKKRVGNVKGIDSKPTLPAKVKPVLGKGKVGVKVVKRFSKGGMVKKKGC